MKISRRGFLGGAIAVGLIGLGGATQVPRELLEAAAAVGRVYLAEHPQMASAERLRVLLGGEATTPLVEALALTLRRRQADFADGRTLFLDGWLLAESEARFCALAYLSDEAGHAA